MTHALLSDYHTASLKLHLLAKRITTSRASHRLEEAKRTLERLLGSMDLYGAPLLVAANKQDLPEAAAALDIQEHFGLGKLDSRPTRVQPMSALKGDGVADGIQWLLTQIQRSDRATRLRQKAVARR